MTIDDKIRCKKLRPDQRWMMKQSKFTYFPLEKV